MSLHKKRRRKITSFQRILEDLKNTFSRDGVTLYNADVLTLYKKWPSPIVIISDGPYGIGQFYGDLSSPEDLPKWYEPHIKAWSEKATPQTTLWFWNSEVGWATVHRLFVEYDWKYVNCHIWDKGISHVAGNSNTKTLRKFPIVTEVCVQYVKEVKIDGMSLQKWLRQEWNRTGLPWSKANEACGVKNAATRKYLTNDSLWYFPPPKAFEGLVKYANTHGNPKGRPYFSLDEKRSLTSKEWKRMRSKFYCNHGITNVWREPPVHGSERLKNGQKSIHLNQKPLKFMEQVIIASSDQGDLVWEPFGGLCTGAIVAYRLKRECDSAEIERRFYELAVRRLLNA